MINFFRKIRQSLLAEGKTVQYLKYALGEIVLVVIGILIALSINNWNTNEANEKQAYNQLIEVQKEILSNIEVFDREDTYYFEKLKDIRRVFADTLTFEDYKNSRSLSLIMASSRPIETQDEAFQKLIQNADNLPSQYKPLVPDLKKLYNQSTLEREYSRLSNLHEQYFDLIIDFSESLYRGNGDAYLQFLLTNKDYKNRLARYSWNLDDLAPNLVRKKYEAIRIYKEMIAIGFPSDGEELLKTMYIEVTPEIANPFIGSYTNTMDTIHIHFQNKDLAGYYTKYNETERLFVKDSSTLNRYGAYLEFNADKSEFYYVMDSRNPYFKRIPNRD